MPVPVVVPCKFRQSQQVMHLGSTNRDAPAALQDCVCCWARGDGGWLDDGGTRAAPGSQGRQGTSCFSAWVGLNNSRLVDSIKAAGLLLDACTEIIAGGAYPKPDLRSQKQTRSLFSDTVWL